MQHYLPKASVRTTINTTPTPPRSVHNEHTAYTRPVGLNLFAEGSQIQSNDFVREPHYRYFSTGQLTRFALLQKEVAYVTQNIRGFMDRLLRAAQGVLGSSKRFSKQWLRTTALGWCVVCSHHASQSSEKLLRSDKNSTNARCCWKLTFLKTIFVSIRVSVSKS